MTAKTRLDKLEKQIQPKEDLGNLVKLEIPLFDDKEKESKVIEITELQLHEMEENFKIVYPTNAEEEPQEE